MDSLLDNSGYLMLNTEGGSGMRKIIYIPIIGFIILIIAVILRNNDELLKETKTLWDSWWKIPYLIVQAFPLGFIIGYLTLKLYISCLQ